jgi:NADP-dependent 3-hydroxy acid dehydrogenase YdfG
MELSGKTLLITGASSGIGAAVARDLGSSGMKVVLSGRRAERLEKLAASLPQACFLAADIADPETPRRLLDLALAEFGSCDVVFNNAGLAMAAPIEEIDIEKVCEMARVNVEAAFRMAYTALKHFKSVGQGHLINTSSVMGTKVRPFAGAYCGTKHALEALSESLRMEVAGTGIAVSCIEPGLVLTDLHRDWETHPTKAFNIPNPLTPEDVARGVRFLLEQPSHVRVPRLLMLPTEHII